MMATFSAQISDRIAAYTQRLEAVFKASAQETVEEATKPIAKGGRMRVKTGFLRSSLMGSTASMPSINAAARPVEGMSYDLDNASIEAVIITAQPGEAIYMGFTASYARVREYRDGMVEGAALGWPERVARNSERAIRAFP